MNPSSYFKGILLFCLSRIHGERSIYAVYHILRGKKSSQTIQDCRLFQLESLFNCYRSLNRGYLDEHIIQLATDGEIIAIDDEKGYYVLTSIGQNSLTEWKQVTGIPLHLDGAHYYPYDDLFWKRLSICFQVLSNLANDNNLYIPITRDEKLLKWVKRWKQQLSSTPYLIQKLYQELIGILQQVDDQHATFFVERLTGFKSIGKTIKQASALLKVDPLYGQMIFLSTLHFMIGMVFKKPDKYPVLFSFLSDLANIRSFTQSTSNTYNLIKKGYSIEEIAFMRKLKLNTIEDHIVEIALLDKSFSTVSFVSSELEEKIKDTSKKLATKKLKLIKEKHPEASYFQIRLVLARQGGKL